MQTHPRYERRTVEWGHWGLTFLDRQPDRSKNFGVIVGQVGFPVGTRGPVDMPKAKWLAMCAAWVERGEMPAAANLSVGQEKVDTNNPVGERR